MNKSEILKRYLKPMTLIIISILFWYYDYKMIGAAVFLIFLINNFYLLQMYWRKDNDKRKFIDDINKSISDNMCNIPFPIVLINNTGDIAWSNERFNDIAKREELLNKNILSVARGLSLDKVLENKADSHQRLKYDGKVYDVHSTKLNDKSVEKEISNKFPILEEISKIDKGNKLEVTLSIGVGRGGISPLENDNFATVAKELALGRGGDQVVIKDNENIKIIGGNTKEIEKRTRVRARVISHALKELIYESEKIYIIGHRNPDMDCFGSAVALASTIRQLGKDCSIILVNYFLDRLKRDVKYNDYFISLDDANRYIDDNDLVIVVDVHNRSYVENIDFIEKSKRKVIIDHHRRSPDMIGGALLNYIEVYASSTSEMITEVIQYMLKDPKLTQTEAEGLLAGIYMDTKGFSFKTGVRTFEAASFLRNIGADTIEVKKMFTDNLEDYLLIAETIKSAKVNPSNNTAIAVCPDNVDTVIVAKSADEMLNISGILAGFVLAKINDDIYISGRSVGDINVQVVLEELGGGGHMNIAGTKMSGLTIEEVIEKLEE